MKIHEYQAKALLARHAVPVPRGEVVRTVDEAEAAAKKIGGSVAIVIPKAIAREMKLADGTSLEISGSGTAIVMRKQGRRPRRRLSEIVSKIKPAGYRRRAIEFSKDQPLGKELW